MKYEILGLLGTVFVLVSFLQKNEIKIRQINILGAGLFAIYGFITKTYSTAILNIALIIIHLKKLKLFKRFKDYINNAIIKDRYSKIYKFENDKLYDRRENERINK